MAGKQVVEVAQDETLEQMVHSLFAGDRMTVTAKRENGETIIVTIKKARVKELSQIMAFMRNILDRVTPQKFEQIITVIADLQKMNLAKGLAPDHLQLDSTTLIQKYKGDSQVLMEALQGCIDLMPEAMAIFTDLSKEAADELFIDDAVMVIVGIVGANYAFFIQSLLPTIRVVIGDWRRKQSVTK